MPSDMKTETGAEKVKEGLEAAIGYSFKDKGLMRTALIHPSYSSENGMERYESNQRMEFLGDAILEAVVSDYLYKEHPETEEGELTRLRASLVFEAALAVCAKDIGLGGYILLGKGEERSGGRDKPSILSDAFEALIGAIFLDGGTKAAGEFIHRTVISEIDEMSLLKDSKSEVQEYVQRDGSSSLRYETVGLKSPDHNKRFRSELYIDDRLIASGVGHSKKAAEQDAARAAIRELGIGK